MVRRLSTMRWAMMLRMRDIGTRPCGGAGVLEASPAAAAGVTVEAAAGTRSAVGSCRALLHVAQDIFLGDAAVRSGSRNLVQVELVFARHAPHQRR